MKDTFINMLFWYFNDGILTWRKCIQNYKAEAMLPIISGMKCTEMAIDTDQH